MMEVPHPTAGWEQVGEKFYRKTQLYTQVFDADLDLDNYIVAGAPYGGAVALYRDEEKLVAFAAGRPSKPSIDIHSCAGKLIRRIPWDKGSIKGLGWSEDEKLLVVTGDGTVRCYYDLQGDFTQFSLGHDADEIGVRSCKFYGHGLVALLNNNSLVSVSAYDEPRPKLLAQPPEGPVHSWSLVPPAYTLSRSVEVLLSIGQTIYVSDASECEDRFIDIGPFSHISISPNGKFVALYTKTGKAHVISSDFQTRLSEYVSKSKIPPQYFEWCGNDAVVIAWEDEVRLVGPGGSLARFYYDNGRIHILPDFDGVRVLANDTCDFLQKVPDVIEEVFCLGTDSPASILLDAVEQLEMQSPKADDNIQLIRSNLVEAVDTCVNAAGQEFSIHWQKQLLKAASFGKSVLDIYNSDDFVDMCETLRVLNAVRFFEIGLPLSYEQYQRLSPSGLIARLLNRREYLLALKIAGYLRLPTDKIYVHWASAKVRVGAEDDDTICRKIVDKLSGKPGISFEAIARAAYDEGRGRLATELLNHEPRAGRQVPLLLSMEEDEVALDKAIESGDTDLVYFVLHQLKRKLPLATFFRVISSRPTATALVEASARLGGGVVLGNVDEGHHAASHSYSQSGSGSTTTCEDTALLKDLYYQDDRRVDGSDVFVREALRQPEARTAADKLALAAKLLSDNAKENAFELSALKEATTLLRMQEAFDRDLHPETFTGLSVNQTVFKLIRLGYHGRAKKVQSEFKVTEKVAWWIRLQALVSKRDWSEIEDLASKNRKSPIGWEPFYTQVLQAGNQRLAATFIPKCAASGGLEPGATIGMYEKCGMRVKAAEEAVKFKDAEAWARLLEEAGRGTQEGREIERLGQSVFRR
ncbi:vacuolar protein sorting-associated protein 16 [Neurospora crassa]|uniref:Probable vacuolar protein sorting-associated protein 16 homolog n=1 Tax=Neurospora crassa (strain ATCC 24698 / 74-OR23-1A / CBS 708.71 / DSM 1257 / FGSC 987) TaxID=367110 RepID=Q7SB72_NEUCR|nr:vacuolar protein sorting-associated protein [Neurospora crassa OR74A]EAA33636.3 vacuolar protein sorting-associated protein [Neurospora crassa OR74A]KHE84301.1 vacuolar protein sorting-associated protein 16 [Neurospora crassa]|eukprot:XP_962872.3 vacuolar protein sorting-associated protein [Neurospora crassa OR74A]